MDYQHQRDIHSKSHHNGKDGFLRSNLFVFLLGQGFAFVCFAVTGAFAWGAFNQKFDNLVEKVARIETKQAYMDEHGTSASDRRILAETKTQEYYEMRLKAVEEQIKKIDVMDGKMNRMDDKLNELRSAAAGQNTGVRR